MKDNTIIITGASDGIGEAAARLLKNQGARVIIVGRSAEKTKAVAAELDTPYYIADFAKLNEVRDLASKLKKAYPRIDVLVNNAGGIFSDRELTVDGYEKTLQVNHLAPFLLTNLLMDTLISSRATIINTSSVANSALSRLDISDINMEHDYTPNRAYGNTKLENILFTKELARRYGELGINTAAFHPGYVTTSFAKQSSSFMRLIYQTPLKRLIRMIPPEQGADTLIWLVTTAPGKGWQSGEYYYKRKIAQAHPLAYDESVAHSLWEQSEVMTTNR